MQYCVVCKILLVFSTAGFCVLATDVEVQSLDGCLAGHNNGGAIAPLKDDALHQEVEVPTASCQAYSSESVKGFSGSFLVTVVFLQEQMELGIIQAEEARTIKSYIESLRGKVGEDGKISSDKLAEEFSKLMKKKMTSVVSSPNSLSASTKTSSRSSMLSYLTGWLSAGVQGQVHEGIGKTELTRQQMADQYKAVLESYMRHLKDVECMLKTKESSAVDRYKLSIRLHKDQGEVSEACVLHGVSPVDEDRASNAPSDKSHGTTGSVMNGVKSSLYTRYPYIDKKTLDGIVSKFLRELSTLNKGNEVAELRKKVEEDDGEDEYA